MEHETSLQNISIDIEDLWKKTLGSLEEEITPANFKTWFRDTYITNYTDGVINIGTPSVFVRDRIRDKFQLIILRILRTYHPDIRGISYTITRRTSPKKQQKKKTDTNTIELPINEFYVDKSDNLNPKYQFETFIVGPFNQLAHAAAKSVANQPGISYNPLFIYGHTGHGKTHLIQAVGNYLKKHGKQVFYVTSERFAVDYFNSLQGGNASKFKNKYRQYDVIIMDDVQFLSYKEKTQEELFHLFNAMYDTNKQIVFSSDIHPSLLDGLEDRLRSRFNQGMIIDIPKPDLESRVAIISSKLAQQNQTLDPESIEYIASIVDGNIREIEGVLNSLTLKTTVLQRMLTFDEVKSFIDNNIQQRKDLTVDEIIQKVAKFYKLEVKELNKKTRQQDIVRPRQLIMYLLREDFQISYPNIGHAFGGRDHTTVIHSCEKIKNRLKTDKDIETELGRIRNLFQ